MVYKRITTKTLFEMKSNNEKISMLTAYDYTFAKIIDQSNVDVILVGDSASNVIAGNETTVPITLDEMIYHAKSVVKAAQRALVVVDLPFGTYQSDAKLALRSAIRIMKESGAHAVKLEGGSEIKDSVSKIIKANEVIKQKELDKYRTISIIVNDQLVYCHYEQLSENNLPLIICY